MKTITLIGTAASSPLIQQVARKEVAMFRIAINKKDFVGERVVLCDTPPSMNKFFISANVSMLVVRWH